MELGLSIELAMINSPVGLIANMIRKIFVMAASPMVGIQFVSSLFKKERYDHDIDAYGKAQKC